MPGRATDPLVIPDSLWQLPQTTQALQDRNIGRLFHLLRQYAGASQTRIAIACGMTQGKVSETMKTGGPQVTTLEVFERIADGLHMPDTARMTLGLAPIGRAEPGKIAATTREPSRLTTSPDLALGSIMGFLDGGQDIEGDMERRQLLQMLAVLGISVSPGAHALDAIRAGIGRTLDSGEGHQLDHWEDTSLEYGYSYLASPPEQFITDLAVDLVSLRLLTREITDRTSQTYRDWTRIAGVLSGLMAKTLSNMGHSRDSLHWWQSAQTAADNSGHLETQLWIRGERLIHGLYEKRAPQLLLRRADEALTLARDHPCAGLASISTARAQALVLAGRTNAAEQELTRAGHILDRLPPIVTDDVDSVNGWGEDRLRYTESWVYAHSGNVAKAELATDRAIRLYPPGDQRSPAQIKLLQAFAHAQAGDITEAIQQAQATYQALPPGHRTTMITNLAAQVLQPVPQELESQPLVTSYREQLALPAANTQKP